MPSADPFSVDPWLLARLVRKNEIIAVGQIRAALNASDHPSKDLPAEAQSRRIRAAAKSVLKLWPDNYQLADAFFHPGAVDAWGLVSRVNSAHSTRFSDEVLRSLYENWLCERGVSKSKALMLSSDPASPHYREADNWRLTTAKILRTSVWIDLRSRDPSAAASWQVNDSRYWPYGVLTCEASYHTSLGEHVRTVVPAGWDWADREYLDAFARDLNRMRRDVRDRGQTLDVYCLNFPTQAWPGRKSKYEIRCERELTNAYLELWKTYVEADRLVREKLSLGDIPDNTDEQT